MDAERAGYFERFQRAMAAHDGGARQGRGRGIVTCGSQKFAPYLWILVRSLRHFGCTLPIECWHMAGEVNAPLRRWLEPYGVVFRDGGALPWGRNRWFNGAHGIKPYAIVHSAFRDVLFLDADNSVSRDPTFLFDAPDYASRGAIFWSDPAPMTAALGGPALRADFGIDPGGDEFESGQLLVDSVRAARALALTVHLNERSGYYYRFLFGDKETFRLAFDAAKQPFLLVRQPADAPHRNWGAKGHVQYWTDGRPLFYHRAGRKWAMDVTRAANHDLAHLPPDLVADLFAELRRRWTTIMPIRERLRPYAGRLRRFVQPAWSSPHLGWVRASVRRAAEWERR